MQEVDDGRAAWTVMWYGDLLRMPRGRQWHSTFSQLSTVMRTRHGSKNG